MVDKHIWLVLGMHRSGTSLLASWLHACGLELGGNTLSRAYNRKGNFENYEVIKYHNEILSRNNTKWNIPIDKKILISKPNKEKVRKLLKQQNKVYSGIWGWKEPRTCLLTFYGVI